MRMMGLVVTLVATTAGAEVVSVKLDGPAIATALTGRALIYDGDTRQTFGADGLTDYDGSQGRWRVDGDQYCSQWPPSDRWSCYDVFAIFGGIRFSDAGGVVDGLYVDN
jgi:hypothetical protein